MNLSNREKKLLLVLGILLAVFLIGYFVYIPLVDERDAAQAELEQKKKDLAVLENKIVAKHEQKKIISSLKDKIEFLQRVLPPSMYQETVIRSLMKLSEKHDLEVTTYDFENVTILPKRNTSKSSLDDWVEEYNNRFDENFSDEVLVAQTNELKEVFEQDKKEEKKEEVNWEDSVGTIEVNLTLEGSYKNIKAAMRELEATSNVVIVKSYSFTKDIEVMNQKLGSSKKPEDNVTGNISLIYPFYYGNQKLKKICWDYESEFKLHNPFVYDERWEQLFYKEASLKSVVSAIYNPNNTGGGSTGNSSSRGFGYDVREPEKPKVEPDFYLVMNPPTSIQPRYMIGKSDARELELQSGRKDEHMELKIVETNNKFSFQYKSDLSAFPQSEPYYPFTPNYKDKIFVKLQSSPRIDGNDLGSVRLKIDNQSSKKVYLILRGDDANRPRLIIESLGSNVTLMRE